MNTCPLFQDDSAALPSKSKLKTGDVSKATGIGKDPTTHTAFLPDKEREQQEQQLREQLKQEYELRQQVCMDLPGSTCIGCTTLYCCASMCVAMLCVNVAFLPYRLSYTVFRFL